MLLKKKRKGEKPKSTKDKKVKVFIIIRNKNGKPLYKIYNKTYKSIY